MSATSSNPLALRATSDATYVNHVAALPPGRRSVVFGGQLVGQLITATSLSGDGRPVVSAHVLFLRPADRATEVVYDVRPLAQGRTFASYSVRATQGDRAVAEALVLRGLLQEGVIAHQVVMPTVAPPSDHSPVSSSLVFPGSEMRVVDDVDLEDPDLVGPPEVRVWTRLGGDVTTEHAQAALAWGTDGFLIGCAMRAHRGFGQAMAHHSLSTGVLSHSIHFHRPFDRDQWLLIANEGTTAAGGVVYGRGLVFSEDGQHIASFEQDSMIRPMSSAGSDRQATRRM